MDRLKTAVWVLLLLAPILPPGAAAAQETDGAGATVILKVVADGLESDVGDVAFALFHSAESFLETPLRPGPPKWEDARFTVGGEDLEIRVDMR